MKVYLLFKVIGMATPEPYPQNEHEVLLESKELCGCGIEDRIKSMVGRIKEWEPANKNQMREIMLDQERIEKIQAVIQEIKGLRDL